MEKGDETTVGIGTDQVGTIMVSQVRKCQVNLNLTLRVRLDRAAKAGRIFSRKQSCGGQTPENRGPVPAKIPLTLIIQ
jgi:hypothetical protein